MMLAEWARRVLAEARLMKTDFEQKLRGPRMASLLAANFASVGLR